ncbi:MAG: homoserine O-succinyltransferase [Oscillospiraceae bacterium]|nr:homoserine O-succinyltransferase [Oscillospiraceae bacterium]
MPIKISDTLPARGILERENIFVMPRSRALRQDIRPLRLVILNLMPHKAITETQLLRCLSNTSLQIEADLLRTSSYTSKNTEPEHLLAHYTTLDEIYGRRYDGMIVTGAPVEHMEFESVSYWRELIRIFDWARNNVYSTFHICWGAQAGLMHRYGIPKTPLPEKLSGIYAHSITDPFCPLTRGFDDLFLAPHSRHTQTDITHVQANPNLQVLAVSEQAGLYAAMSKDGKEIYITGHPEYDTMTLSEEYARDLRRGLNPGIPYNYFPGNDPNAAPPQTWRSHAHLLYSNWLNYYVYQTTPFDLEEL